MSNVSTLAVVLTADIFWYSDHQLMKK